MDDTIYESILCMMLYTTVFSLAFAKIIGLHIVGVGEFIQLYNLCKSIRIDNILIGTIIVKLQIFMEIHSFVWLECLRIEFLLSKFRVLETRNNKMKSSLKRN